jgi:hypothetical protein
MMLPRGKKSVAIVRDVVSRIFERTMEAWDEDNHTFTKGPKKKAKVKTAAKKSRPGRKRQ